MRLKFCRLTSAMDKDKRIIFENGSGSGFFSYVLKPNKDLISEHIIKHGSWEKDLVNKAKSFLKPDSVALDIGANIGTWSLELSRACKRVYAFEPQPETFNQLCANLVINGCENVTPHRIALGSHKQSGSQLSMKIESKNNGHSRISKGGSVTVDVKSLDDYGLERIDFIKMDVEGFELNVLEGASRTIEKFHPVVFFEAWPGKRKGLFKWFKEMGYTVHHFSKSDYYAVFE